MKTVYSVIANYAGYLPTDDAPYATTNRRDAERVAASMARELREEGGQVSGSAKGGYVCYGEEDDPAEAIPYVINIYATDAAEWVAMGNELPE